VSARLRAAVIALLCALACGFLGSRVSEAPPGTLDRAGGALAGTLPALAVLFTESGRWWVLVPLGIAAIVLAIVRPEWRARAIFSVVVTLVAWQGSDALKNLFMRSRPPYWIVTHESSWAYPSGHAMFAVVIFGLWSCYFATSNLRRALRRGLAVFCALWALGMIWSRLALGAHYVTDLIGGVLFGITMLAIAAAVTNGFPRLGTPANVTRR
jgi:membrane-associated phospholipid phosphatase